MLLQPSINIILDIAGILSLFFMAFSVADQDDFHSRKNRLLFDIFLLLIGLMSCDAISSIYENRLSAIPLLNAVNIAGLLFAMLLNIAFANYVRLDLGLLDSDWPISTRLSVSAVGVTIAAVLLNPVHHLIFEISPETGEFVRKELFSCVSLVTASVLALCVLQILFSRGILWKKRITMLFYCLLPLVSLLPQFYSFNLLIPNMAALSTAMIIYADSYLEQCREFSKKELELQNTRAALVLSQIQPHFLFNSIAAVMDLCDTDPAEAKAALQDLSDYLHYKISALSNSYVVSFQEDMEFSQNYLKLEKRRFGDRLRVEWDTQATDFQIPLLTLQPLVENSIRHGISKRPSGGVIRIRSWETKLAYFISVEDNGAGFDADKDYKTSGQHVGLNNVKIRLEALCGGELTVQSTPGVGTCVQIQINK